MAGAAVGEGAVAGHWFGDGRERGRGGSREVSADGFQRSGRSASRDMARVHAHWVRMAPQWGPLKAA